MDDIRHRIYCISSYDTYQVKKVLFELLERVEKLEEVKIDKPPHICKSTDIIDSKCEICGRFYEVTPLT